MAESVSKERDFSEWNSSGTAHLSLRRHLCSVGVRKCAGGADNCAESPDADVDERAAAEPEYRRPASNHVLYAVHVNSHSASRLYLRPSRLRTREIHARCELTRSIATAIINVAVRRAKRSTVMDKT